MARFQRGERQVRFSIAATCARVTLALALMVGSGPAPAWIYPEHRDLALLAVQGLDAGRRATFDRL